MFQLLTKNGRTALWYAASEGHNSVLYYLLREKHDSYSLLEDRRVSNIVIRITLTGKVFQWLQLLPGYQVF